MSVRTYNKHDPAKIAKRVLKAGGTVKGPQVGGYAELRAALREKIVKPTSKRARTGKRGRPAVYYTLTLKGRNLAKRA